MLGDVGDGGGVRLRHAVIPGSHRKVRQCASTSRSVCSRPSYVCRCSLAVGLFFSSSVTARELCGRTRLKRIGFSLSAFHRRLHPRPPPCCVHARRRTRCFAAALTKYQTRSLIVLYDTIGTLADNAGGLLAQPDLLAVLMPPLMQRWNQVRSERATNTTQRAIKR